MKTVVHCLAQTEKRGGYRQKTYDDTYWRMMDTAAKKLVESVKECFEDLVLGGGQSGKNGLRSEEKRETVMGMSKMKTSV